MTGGLEANVKEKRSIFREIKKIFRTGTYKSTPYMNDKKKSIERYLKEDQKLSESQLNDFVHIC